MTCTSSTSKENIVDLTEMECNQSSDAPEPDLLTRKKKKKYVVWVPSRFFVKISSAEKSSVYKCVMGCMNKTVTVSNDSLYNARRHLEAYHKAKLPEFNASIQEHKEKAVKCKVHVQGNDLPGEGKQGTIEKHLVNSKDPHKTPIVTQSDLDDRIMHFIVQDMNSLRTVEKGGFKWLMDGLTGNLKVKKRTFFTEKLKRDYSNTKTALCMALEKATDICTTADMWTSHKRSYLGMTAHWKGEDLKRRSACLGIRRVKGHHTYDVIATEINKIHMEFKISKKVNVMITDSGSNFLKAFRIFGPNEVIVNEDISQNEEDDNYEPDDDEDFVYTDLDAIIQDHNAQVMDQETEENEDADADDSDTELQQMKLPYHVKCPCHLLNLIATADVQKITNPTFKKLKKRLTKNCKRFGISEHEVRWPLTL